MRKRVRAGMDRGEEQWGPTLRVFPSPCTPVKIEKYKMMSERERRGGIEAKRTDPIH